MAWCWRVQLLSSSRERGRPLTLAAILLLPGRLTPLVIGSVKFRCADKNVRFWQSEVNWIGASEKSFFRGKAYSQFVIRLYVLCVRLNSGIYDAVVCNHTHICASAYAACKNCCFWRYCRQSCFRMDLTMKITSLSFWDKKINQKFGKQQTNKKTGGMRTSTHLR